MAFLQNSDIDSQISPESLIAQVYEIYGSIAKLESLRPSKEVNALFTRLVTLCTPPSDIEIESLDDDDQKMHANLIVLCGRAEGLLEHEFAMLLTTVPKPLDNLHIFPYYGNYKKLATYEYEILHQNGCVQPKKLAFLGSGPMPVTSIVMARDHLKFTHFDNYDFDSKANDVAREIVASDIEFEKRIKFITRDVMEVKEAIVEYDCVFLAALVGIRQEDKIRIIRHIRKYMKKGAYLLVRSAKGARAFLYPVIEKHYLLGFEVISTFHPTDDVINSVMLAQKPFF